MKFAFILGERAWTVAMMCRVLKVSRSGFYAFVARKECLHARKDRQLRVLCVEAHVLGRQKYGSPRVHRALKAKGIRTSKKRVARLMRECRIHVRPRKRWTTTTDSAHAMTAAPNLLNREFKPSEPNRLWAGDVTYLRTPDGFMYLAVVIDLFSRLVVGWAVSGLNDRHLAVKALEMAVERRRPSPGLLHHTDRGSPYASEDFQQALEVNGMVCSMSRLGNCWDNAVVESFFKTFKAEEGEDFEGASDVRARVFDYIEVFFNQTRLHSTLGYLSPANYEKVAASIPQAA